MNKISVSDLRIIFDKLIQKLEHEHGIDGMLELETLHYRIIPTEKWADFSESEKWNSSKEVDVGDLQDDLFEINKILTQKERIVTYVDFDRVASILREISEVYNPI